MKRRPPRTGSAPYAKRYRAATGAMVPRAPTYRKRRSPALAQVLGVENKYFDADKSAAQLVTSWAGAEFDPAANCVGVPTQGSGASNREGTRILVKSLQVVGFVQRYLGQDQADMRSASVVQVALVMDTQTNGVQLNAEDVYTASTCPGTRVMANTSRYKVLRTQCFDMYDTAAGTDGANTNSVIGNGYHFAWFIKLNQAVNFIDGAGAGAVADIKDVSFHIIARTSASTSADYLQYHFRMRFVG